MTKILEYLVPSIVRKYYVTKAFDLLDCMYDRNKSRELCSAWRRGEISAFALARKAEKAYRAEGGHTWYPSFVDTIKEM